MEKIEKEQQKPLAPALAAANSTNAVVDENGPRYPVDSKNRGRRRCVICCGCTTAILLILVVTIIILAFTVFKVKDPKMTLNGITVEGIDTLINLPNLRPSANLTIIADVSIKNPNAASFRFGTGTTSLYYNGVMAGEATNPPGNAKARGTIRMNDVRVVILLENLLAISPTQLMSDVRSGMLPLDSVTKISGRVKVLFIHKHAGVTMSCNMKVNITSQEIQDQTCKRKVSL